MSSESDDSKEKINANNDSKEKINDNNDSKEDVCEKRAVITGGASGIGKGIAIKCGLKQFAIIVIVDINKTALDITRDELCALYPSIRIYTFAIDITKRENICIMRNTLTTEHGIHYITHLFNNAGVADGKALLTVNSDENTDRLHRMMNVNFWSHVYMTQMMLILLRKYKEQSSYIINTVSLSAQKQSEDIYCITKHALSAYTETLYNELRDTNVNVLCVCPGNVNTFLVKNSAILFNDYETDKEYKEKVDEYQTKWLQGTGESVKDVVNKVFDAIQSKEKLFWINTDQSATKHYATLRYDSIIKGVYLTD